MNKLSKYKVEIKEIGESAEVMLETQQIILFNEQAPKELKEFCVITDSQPVQSKIQPGDTLSFEDLLFTITAVGDVANDNLNTLGHVTLCFDGATESKLPGHIHLDRNLDSFNSIKNMIEIK